MSHPARSRASDYAALIFMTLVWGLSWPVTVVGLRYSDPLLMASLRCFLGGVALFAWRGWTRAQEQFDWRTLVVTAIAGAGWVGIPTALTMWALQYISGGLGSILQSTIPFFVAILAFLYLKENRLTPVKILGLLIGFVGIVVLFSDDPISANTWQLYAGGAALIAGAMSIAFAQVFSRKHYKGRDQVGFNMYMQLFGGLVILPFSFFGGIPHLSFTVEFTFVIIFLGVFATAIPFTLYFEMFQRVDIVVLSMMAYVIPVVAVLAGIVWLEERMTPTDIAGALLVLAGVVLATQYHSFKARFLTRSIS